MSGSVIRPFSDAVGVACRGYSLPFQRRITDFGAVIAVLELLLEPSSVQDQDAPVRACLRYMRNRPTQFDYAAAIQAGLPIGSGKIESAHRYIIQERMKIPGAWWKIENADDMLALRSMRANGNWDDYWR